MGQKIGNVQNGVGIVLTDGDVDHIAVLAVHSTVNGQRDGCPLILLHAAVVMGLEEGQLGILIQRIGLQVQTGGIHVSSTDIGAVGQAFAADHRQNNALIAVVKENLIAGLDVHTRDHRLKAVLHSHGDRPSGSFPLGLAGIHKFGIALAVVLHFGSLFFRQGGIAVLGSKEQGVFQFFHIGSPFRGFLLL